MKRLTAIMLTSLALLLATITVVGAVEIRGKVATGDDEWNPQNFAGFFYDIKDNLGTETLKTTITEGNKLQEPTGVTYTTTAQKKAFEFEGWGYYNVIGFLAQKYFAGYVDDANIDNADEILLTESTDENSLSDEQLQTILVDNDDEITVTSGTPLKLEEGYELGIKSIDIDGNKVYLELTKNGDVVDSKVISPSKDNPTMSDKTYYYKTDVGAQNDLVIIGVHFKNAFRGADQNLATIDGVWQISDTASEVQVDTEYDKMRIATVDSTNGVITMDNKDNTITLSRNKDISLMENVRIKTADNATLRYYIYKEVTEPGTYELRGSVATADAEWNPQNFAGFFYDIKDDLGTETLKTAITEGNKLQEPTGVTYTTTAQKKEFDFEGWGYYNVIGFLAQKYFAGYVDDANIDNADEIPLTESTDENSLSDEQLQTILVDNDDEITVTSGTPLKLEEGYELGINSIDIDGNKVYLELTKNGDVVDSKVISPSKDNPTMSDKTYYYKTDVGAQNDLVIIAVHFKNAFRGADQNLATIDGVWQISDTASEVQVDTEYDKMRIATVDSTNGVITMDNKDNTITLSRNKDISLMENVRIKTADNATLRYYIYKPVTIEGAAPANVTEAAAPANVTEAAPAEEAGPAEAAAPATEETPAGENVTEAAPAAEKPAAEAAPAAANETAAPAAQPSQPGFEGIFAITGLLAVAYLVLGRRE